MIFIAPLLYAPTPNGVSLIKLHDVCLRLSDAIEWLCRFTQFPFEMSMELS